MDRTLPFVSRRSERNLGIWHLMKHNSVGRFQKLLQAAFQIVYSWELAQNPSSLFMLERTLTHILLYVKCHIKMKRTTDTNYRAITIYQLEALTETL